MFKASLFNRVTYPETGCRAEFHPFDIPFSYFSDFTKPLFSAHFCLLYERGECLILHILLSKFSIHEKQLLSCHMSHPLHLNNIVLFLKVSLIKGVGYTSGGFAVFVTPVHMTGE